MKRLVSRVGVRAASVGLLVLGVVGGVYLGQDQIAQSKPAEASESFVLQSSVDENQLIRERHSRNVSDRAARKVASGDAAEKAAAQAQAAAGKARKSETEAIKKKEAEEKAKAEAEAEESGGSSSGGSGVSVGPIPASCSEYSGNRETGCALMIDAGFGIDQFPCLNKLWNKESGWNERASNPSSGAYGIPQSLPGSKMSSVGSDWRTNAATQIKWGLGYIEGRYGTPCSAWGHSQDVGWY